MTNEEKANEIARDMLPYNNAEYHACYNSAIKAMEWKDEQYKKLLDLLVESGADADIITNYIKNCIEL